MLENYEMCIEMNIENQLTNLLNLNFNEVLVWIHHEEEKGVVLDLIVFLKGNNKYVSSVYVPFNQHDEIGYLRHEGSNPNTHRAIKDAINSVDFSVIQLLKGMYRNEN